MPVYKCRIPLNPLKKRIFAKLNVDSASWATQASVYDVVPDSPTFPFVELGAFSGGSEASKGPLVFVATQELNCWSQASTPKEVNDIANQVAQSLTDEAIAAELEDGFKLLFSQRDEANFVDEEKLVNDQGRVTRHLSLRVKFYVEDTLV